MGISSKMWNTTSLCLDVFVCRRHLRPPSIIFFSFPLNAAPHHIILTRSPLRPQVPLAQHLNNEAATGYCIPFVHPQFSIALQKPYLTFIERILRILLRLILLLELEVQGRLGKIFCAFKVHPTNAYLSATKGKTNTPQARS
ncbi:hypothetical protein GALMADRAFT_243799 [Galerina marginata CBS 339.88]|uniref:Uncharacterized protein n=1 Tax=Galerina marginata (strain CBS 339.88) TaxID=685588 RepID=A0A067T5K3_GALM3|nr:hypothetical protein GALMADRAFT_243799 [Galerina marginata CBS 339.88]